MIPIVANPAVCRVRSGAVALGRTRSSAAAAIGLEPGEWFVDRAGVRVDLRSALVLATSRSIAALLVLRPPYGTSWSIPPSMSSATMIRTPR